MSKLKLEVIKYSKKLNITNLSALRSGNISVRAREKGVEGFYITPSGMKYSSLKIKDIVFVSLKGIFDKKKKKTIIRVEISSRYLSQQDRCKSYCACTLNLCNSCVFSSKKHTSISLYDWCSRRRRFKML